MVLSLALAGPGITSGAGGASMNLLGVPCGAGGLGGWGQVGRKVLEVLGVHSQAQVSQRFSLNLYFFTHGLGCSSQWLLQVQCWSGREQGLGGLLGGLGAPVQRVPGVLGVHLVVHWACVGLLEAGLPGRCVHEGRMHQLVF